MTALPYDKEDTHEKLLAALMIVESNGDLFAIGDKHLTAKAYGPLQIRQPAVTDVNNRFGTDFRAEDMLGNLELSKWVFRRYMDIYATETRLGREVTDRDRARIWNGGPNAWKTKGTAAVYWEAVRKVLA